MYKIQNNQNIRVMKIDAATFFTIQNSPQDMVQKAMIADTMPVPTQGFEEKLRKLIADGARQEYKIGGWKADLILYKEIVQSPSPGISTDPVSSN